MITTFTRLNIVKEMFSLHFYYDCFYTARLRVYYMLNPVECKKRTFAGLKIWSAVEHIERARLSKLICAFALLRSISTGKRRLLNLHRLDVIFWLTYHII